MRCQHNAINLIFAGTFSKRQTKTTPYRYGNEGFDALINSEENWLPTMLATSVTPEMFIASLSAED